MSDSSPPPDLLAHADFVRGLAVHLLRDDAEADDVAQDSLVRALERPPRERATLRSWLAVVVRRTASNARRATSRRVGRERRAARPEAVAAAGESAAAAEILHTVAEAVRSLDPSAQRLVLMRHYEGLPPREIAARLGTPVETVRSDLARAHARLRRRLDESEQGNVGGWRSALAGLVGMEDIARTGVPVGGGIAVATTTKVGIGIAGAVCLVGGVWWGATRLGSHSPEGSSAPTAVASSGAPARPGLAVKPNDEHAPPAVASPTAPAESALPTGWTRRGIGRIALLVPEGWEEEAGHEAGSATWARTDESGRPRIAFAVVPRGGEFAKMLGSKGEHVAAKEVFVDGRTGKWDERTYKGNAGVLVTLPEGDASLPEVVFALMAPRASWETDRATLEAILASVRFLSEPPVVSPGGESERPSVALLDSIEKPLSGPVIEGTVLRGSKPLGGMSVELVQDAPGTPKVEQHTVSDADGAFRFAEVPRGQWALEVGTPSETRLRVSLVSLDRPHTRLAIVLGTGVVEGSAFDRQGRPATGLPIHATIYTRPNDRPRTYRGVVRADGSYRIDQLPAASWSLAVYLSTSYIGSDVRSALVTLKWGETKRIDLGNRIPEARLSGTLRSSGGAHLAGPAVYLMLERADGSMAVPVPVDAQGRYEQRLPPGTYDAAVGGLAFAQPTSKFQVTVGSTDLESDVTLASASVSGLVWDLATRSAPVRGEWSAVVYLEPTAGGQPPTTYALADGTFAFHGVLPGSYRLHAEFGSPALRRRSEPVLLEVSQADVSGLRLELPRK